MPSLLSRICSLIEIRLLSNIDDCNSFLLFPLDWKTPAIRARALPIVYTISDALFKQFYGFSQINP